MSNYRRLISYIYAYEGGIKGKNVGFAKLEVRNGQCKIQVNVRNVYIGNQDTGVYLLSGSEEILVGRIFIRNGAGEFRAVVSVSNVAGSGHSIDQCYGLTVHNLSDSWQCYTTIWEDAVAHAAEVVLEEATSERVKKEEPVQGAVSKAVEEEIEVQSRKAKESKVQEELPSPSSVIPPVEQAGEEILRPGDMETMELRPMEVLPIGKELKAADLGKNGSQGESELTEERREDPTVGEHTGGNGTESLEESAADRTEQTGDVRKESESMQGGQEVKDQGLAETEEPEGPQRMDQSPDVGLWREENHDDPDGPEQNGQLRMQSTSQQGMSNNSQPQPARSNQWGQTGILFPPNWFARPNRQSRPVSSPSGRQIHPGSGTGARQMPVSGPGFFRQEEVLQPVGTSSPGEIPSLAGSFAPQPGPAVQNQPQRFGEPHPEPFAQSQPQGFGQAQPEPINQPQSQPSGQSQSQASGQGQDQPSGQGQSQPSGQGQSQASGQGQNQASGQNRSQLSGQGQSQPSGQGQSQAFGQGQSQAFGQGQSQPSGQGQSQPSGQGQSQPSGQDQGKLSDQIQSPVQNEQPGHSRSAAAEQSRPANTIGPESHISEDEPKIDNVWQRFYKTYPKIQAFDYNGGCEILTIKPQDIGLLPRETWGYGNNSFLLHGYYNHRYLIFARLNNPKGRPRYLLGVPGHYFSNEKYMAAMFGFPNFVLSKVQPTGDDRFGYWYTDIRLGS